MKGDFSKIIMMPNSKGEKTESNSSLVGTPHNSNSDYLLERNYRYNSRLVKLLLVTTLLFIIWMTVVATTLVVRYETKFERFEERIFKLERELEQQGKVTQLVPTLKRELEKVQEFLGEEEEQLLEYETHPQKHFDDEDDEPLLYDGDDEDPEEEEGHFEGVDEGVGVGSPKEFKGESGEELLVHVGEKVGQNGENEFGEVKLEVKEGRRNKRQIPYPNTPTFGPDVERTRDGVPIVEESYLTSLGVTLKPRYQTTPSHDSDGLRLYDRLVDRDDRGRGGLLPHHQVSAAWSEKDQSSTEQTSSRPRPRIQLKSGDFGRNQQIRQSQTSTPFTSSNTNSNSNVLVSGGVGSGATYHRNSRVPSTGDYFYPGSGSSTTRSSDRNNNNRVQYPLRKFSLGDGEGEVVARVLQSERESENEAEPQQGSFAGANLGQSEAEGSFTRQRVHQSRRHYQNHEPSQVGGVTSQAHTQSFRTGARKWSNRKVIMNSKKNANANAMNASSSVPFTKYFPANAYDAEGTRNGAKRAHLPPLQSMEAYLTQSQYYNNIPLQN